MNEQEEFEFRLRFEQESATPKEKPSFGSMLKDELMKPVKNVGNLVAGGVRGAGSIGATLLAPVDYATDYIKGDRSSNTLNQTILKAELGDRYKAPLSRNEERRQGMDAGLQSMGADPESLMYQGGKIGAEIAGTAGAGGVVGNALTRVPGLATAAPSFINAVRTSGMSTGAPAGNILRDLAIRSAGGAVSGGAMAGMVNPQDALSGAAIGGAAPVAIKAAGAVGKAIGGGVRRVLGGTTGVGDAALSQAYRAGKQGGVASDAFREGMRGTSQIDDVLSVAKQNLDAMGQQKQAAYRAGMANIKADKSVLDMVNIGKSADDALSMVTFKGQVKNERAANAVQGIKAEIEKWRGLDPAEFHTPEGLDALKQKIGSLIEEIPFEQKTARAAAEKVYTSIKGEITKQAPEYSKVMRNYQTASETIKEIERSLSLGKRAAADTSLRKLQSLMRNNVNTSYGYRTSLAKELEQAGGQEIMPSLAGQAVSDWLPRGIQRAATGTGGGALALTGNLPAAAGLAAVSSPRLVGEAYYGAGRLANIANRSISPALGMSQPNVLEQLIYRSLPVMATR